MKRAISIVISLTLVAAVFTGCGKGNNTSSGLINNKPKGELVVEDAGTDEYAKYDTTGEVTVAINTVRPADSEALFDAFSNVYPNIKLKFVYYSDVNGAGEYLTTKAATGELPDVIFDDPQNLQYYLTQGWVYPLDSYVKGDKIFEDCVPKNLVENYTFNGKLYALPHQCGFAGFFVNMDILDELNLDMPDYDWTVTDMIDFMKKTTTDKYSAIEDVGAINGFLPPLYSKGTDMYAYNPSTHHFDISAIAKGAQVIRELREYPGLEGWSLNLTADASGKTDYERKFGVKYVAGKLSAWYNGGMALLATQGTWNYAQEKELSNFTLGFLPYPQSSDMPGRMQIHVDHCFMTTAAKNPDAAFQVLRYITYSTEGNLARLSMYDEENKGKYALNSDKYFPTTTNEKVAEKFKSLPSVTEQDVYFFENIKNGYRGDPWKYAPGVEEVIGTVISPIALEVIGGGLGNSALSAELERKANAAMDKAIAEYNAKVNKAYAEFNAAH